MDGGNTAGEITDDSTARTLVKVGGGLIVVVQVVSVLVRLWESPGAVIGNPLGLLFPLSIIAVVAAIVAWYDRIPELALVVGGGTLLLLALLTVFEVWLVHRASEEGVPFSLRFYALLGGDLVGRAMLFAGAVVALAISDAARGNPPSE